MNDIMNEQIINNIDDKYICETVTYIMKPKKKTNKMIKFIGKVAASIVVVWGLSISSLSIAVAAGNMTAYEILYFFYPDIAVKLTPVNVSCEDEGILMEVEGVYVRENRADIYISMQDLEGDRIDESIDLFDSYSIHTSYDQAGGCSLVDYDAESNKATFLISIQHMSDQKIAGEKMTFSVSQFLSGKTEMNGELNEIHLDSIPVASETQAEVDIRGTGGSGLKDSEVKDIDKYLIADESKAFSPTEGVTITNYGFIDNKLHVQAYYEDILQYDNHGYVYLMDSEGNVNNSLTNIAFWDNDRVGSYEEYIFDIKPEELSEYTIWGHFYTCESLTQGEWKVSFPIENKAMK